MSKKFDSEKLLELMKSRRDVRGNSFLSKKVDEKSIKTILASALCAPSVGYSQPWKFVIIEDDKIKTKIYDNFQKENTKAKEIFKTKELYKKLKLEGIKEAPLNIAVLYEKPKEDVLGMTTLYKMGEYSVVCAVQNMWLMARSLDIGLGWVSILDDTKVLNTLHLDANEYELIAYLCLGYVDEFKDEPELKTLRWKDEKSFDDLIIKL